MAMDDPPMKAMEEVGDVDQLKADLSEAQERLSQLHALEEGLGSIKSTNNPAFAELSQLAIKLGVNDSPPPKCAPHHIMSRSKRAHQPNALSLAPSQPHRTPTLGHLRN
eukprot:9085847-Pyramimonas_sp.AAC.2